MFVNNKKLLFLRIIIFLFLFCACSDNELAIDTTQAIDIKTVSVVEGKLEEELNSFGTTTYKTKNDVTALVEGTITSLYIKESDVVVEGQILARLRNVQLEIQLEQTENALVSAKASLFLTETKLMEAKLGVESRLLSLEQSALRMEQLKLELQDLEETMQGKKELLSLGGITDSAFKSLQLSVSAKKVELAVMEKQEEISLLGLRDKDLLSNGYTPAEDESERIVQLIELNTRSIVAEIEAAHANVENAEKSLLAIQKLFDELTIRSPISGIIGVRYFENGEYVPKNEKITTIIDISTALGVFSIQEQDIIHFQVGTPLLIEIPSMGRTESCAITEISPIADPQSGNFSIKTEFDNEDLAIKPGMFIKCTIYKGEEKSYPVIPETALLQKTGQVAKVFCVINDFAVMKDIVIYFMKDGKVWVTEGISVQDIIIDKPSPFLKEGQYVKN